MSQIDWNKAPEGATHFSPSCEDYYPCWCKWVDGRLFGWLSDGDSSWSRILDQERNQEKIKAMIARPIVEKWTGEGLPPVGTVCESMWNESRDEWLKAKVFGVNEHGQPIFRWEEGVKKYEYQASPLSGHSGKPYFRPIRTPEQNAEDHLFRRITTLSALHRIPMSESGAEQLARSLAKDGYSKFEIKESEK